MGLQMYECVKTGAKDGLHHISLEEGGLVADDVLGSAKSPVYISDEAIYTIRYILSRGISSVYSFDVKPEISAELSELMDKYILLNTDRHFKSLDILAPL